MTRAKSKASLSQQARRKKEKLQIHESEQDFLLMKDLTTPSPARTISTHRCNKIKQLHPSQTSGLHNPDIAALPAEVIDKDESTDIEIEQLSSQPNEENNLAEGHFVIPTVPTIHTAAVYSFLQSINVEKYCDIFAHEEIDIPALKLMTEEDLITLKIPMGPRKKILNALKSTI